jgi:hypothetical protein
MKLKQGESYLWLLPIVWAAMAGIAIVSVAATGSLEYFVLAIPGFVILFTLYEIWSGVALDSWWRASHPKGTGSYYGLIAWQLFVSIAFTIFFFNIE